MILDTDTMLSLSEQVLMENGLNLRVIYTDDLYQHSYSVAYLSVRLGQVYNLNTQELLDLGVGGLLHDYGKVTISDAILQKPAALSEMESYLIRAHPAQGYRDIKQMNRFNKNVLDIILMHHEKLDGSGYPSAISDIPLIVQIVTITDMYDAIHTKRSYHDAVSVEKTLDILSKSPGLNPVMVKLFSDMMLVDAEPVPVMPPSHKHRFPSKEPVVAGNEKRVPEGEERLTDVTPAKAKPRSRTA